MLTSKERATLRSMANDYDAIFQIGKGGVTEEIVRRLNEALEARELIKIKALENSGYSAREAADEISEKTASDVVSVVGRCFVLYRESKKKKKIEL